MKKCEYCGEMFEPDRPRQIYHPECAREKHNDDNRKWAEKHPERKREANRRHYEKYHTKDVVKERRKEIFCIMTEMSRERYLQIKKDLGMVE